MSVTSSHLAFEDVAIAARLFWGLPSFLCRTIGPDEARATVRRRLERREADFLTVARAAIYGNLTSPYRELLAQAGCTYPDLERLVSREGLSGALESLFRSGVYLSVDEFKGRQPVVRGSAVIAIDPRRLANRLTIPRLPVQTSGSRGRGTSNLMDLAFIRDCSTNVSLHFAARGNVRWQKATWETPGGGMLRVLQLSGFGDPAARWFSQVSPEAPGFPPRYRWGPRVLRLAGLVAFRLLPGPEFVPLDSPLPIAHWMVDALRVGDKPSLIAFPSSAVRLSQAALEAGMDLRGAHVVTIGEPLTETRLSSIRRAGLTVYPAYGSMEVGPIGYGCLAPRAADDIHLFTDLHALIQPTANRTAGNLPGRTILISSLRPTAPMVMLNVSLGDEATIEERDCACPLAEVGWRTHLFGIRSFEKLTAGGTTLLDAEIIRVLEKVLPTRFGGGPTDYQLVEMECSNGLPRVRLIVHPDLGELSSDTVAEVFLSAIGQGSPSERVHGMLWRQPGLLQVERRPPVATGSGKILHLKVEA